MLAYGIIERSNTAFNNSHVPVIRKDRDIRLCLDARELNKKLQPDHDEPEDISLGLEQKRPFEGEQKFWRTRSPGERVKCRVAYESDLNMALILMSSRALLLECDDVYEDEAMDAFYTNAPTLDQELEMTLADMGYASSSSDLCEPQLDHYLDKRHDPNKTRQHRNLNRKVVVRTTSQLSVTNFLLEYIQTSRFKMNDQCFTFSL